MVYIKTKLNDQEEIKVYLYEDEIYSTCPVCEREYQLDRETLSQIDDWGSTSITCGDADCNKKFREEMEKLYFKNQHQEKVTKEETEPEQVPDNEESVHELLHKQRIGELTIEEANELTNKSIALAVESMEAVSEIRKQSRIWEEAAYYWNEAAIVFQDYIKIKGLDDDFTLYVSELTDGEQNDPAEDETTSPEEIIH